MSTKTPVRMASPKTLDYIDALLRDRQVHHETVESLEDFRSWMTQAQASDTIDRLKALPWKARTGANTDPVTEPGIYETATGWIFQAKYNREKTNLYTLRFNADTNKYEYVGAVGKCPAHPADRITLDRAIELSAARGRCIRCDRVLKAGKSVREGIGPVCAKYIAEGEQ